MRVGGGAVRPERWRGTQTHARAQTRHTAPPHTTPHPTPPHHTTPHHETQQFRWRWCRRWPRVVGWWWLMPDCVWWPWGSHAHSLPSVTSPSSSISGGHKGPTTWWSTSLWLVTLTGSGNRCDRISGSYSLHMAKYLIPPPWHPRWVTSSRESLALHEEGCVF